MSAYRYTLHRTMRTSSILGVCEICGKAVDGVYHQIEERNYTRPDGTHGWTREGCKDVFGHEVCLMSSRRHDHCQQNLAARHAGADSVDGSTASRHHSVDHLLRYRALLQEQAVIG